MEANCTRRKFIGWSSGCLLLAGVGGGFFIQSCRSKDKDEEPSLQRPPRKNTADLLIFKYLETGPLAVNCYIIGDKSSREAVVVDPGGGDIEPILSLLAEDDLRVKAIINTHSHFDHIGGNAALKRATGAPIMIHRAEKGLLTGSNSLARQFGYSFEPSPPADRLLEDGDLIKLGTVVLEVLHTPGHSPGGISLKIRGLPIVLVGDALFWMSVGRTDFPCGSHHQLIRSIKEKLIPLGENYEVYPGHGPLTVMGWEQRYNPFLNQPLTGDDDRQPEPPCVMEPEADQEKGREENAAPSGDPGHLQPEDIEYRPKLRVSPVPVEIGEEKMLMFNDPEQIIEETVLLPFEAAVIIQYFDGSMTVAEIQEKLMSQTGELIPSSIIQDLIEELDEKLLLYSPRYREHVDQITNAWARLRVRPAYHAGSAYPDNRDEVIRFLDNCYLASDGPGNLPGEIRSNRLTGILSPHMSPKFAGPCWAYAFKTLAENTKARLFIIFGTGHQEPVRPFVLSDKNFETPLGVAETDRELIKRITRLRKNRNPLNDYVHKTEHSIEFMVLFLQHALRNRPDFRILPILCSGFAMHVLHQIPPAENPEFKDFMKALEIALDERGEPVCFISSGDLAHLGPRYGDIKTYGPEEIPELEALDRAMLKPLLKADADDFFLHITREKDSRRICGLPPTYAMLKAGKPERGEILKWSRDLDSPTQSVVTYAAMAFY